MPDQSTNEAEFVYRAAVPRAQSGDRICWTLVGEHGAVELWSFTKPAEYDPRSPLFRGDYLGGVEIHSRTVLYPEWNPNPTIDSCALLGGAPCWSDGSSLAADSLLPRAFAGEDMRGELLAWYRGHFAEAATR